MESKRVFFVAHLFFCIFTFFSSWILQPRPHPFFVGVKPRAFFFQRSFRLTCICGHDANEHSQQRIDGAAWRFSDDPSWRLWCWGKGLGFGRWRMRTPLFTRGCFWCTRIHQFLINSSYTHKPQEIIMHPNLYGWFCWTTITTSKQVHFSSAKWPDLLMMNLELVVAQIYSHGGGRLSFCDFWRWMKYNFLHPHWLEYDQHGSIFGPHWHAYEIFQLLLAIFANDLVIQFGGLNCDDWVPN